MLLADTLVVLGLATVNLGVIQEADGPREHTFWLQNAGSRSVTLQQGYTSCGCTTIRFDRQGVVASGDSTAVTLRFNPRGKGGEFHEIGTIVYGTAKKRINISLTGKCITSEETLLRQFPVRINDKLRLSANRFDVGIMHVGESKERNVVVLHRDDHDRQERIPVRLTIDNKTPKGLQHLVLYIKTQTKGRQQSLPVTFDVIVK